MRLVIPTLWKCREFIDALDHYVSCGYVENVVIIDNNPTGCPKNIANLLGDKKITYISLEKNIYVNPAWNLGVRTLRYSDDLIGIVNDDIFLGASTLGFLAKKELDTGVLIGLLCDRCGSSAAGDIVLDRIYIDPSRSVGTQVPGFGSALFMRRSDYSFVPDELRIWFGDDWLISRMSRIYGLAAEDIVISKHVSMKAMRANSSFRQRLADDKQAAQRLLGIVFT